ncbi:SMI1/KNR4 family protein [Nocardia sp. NPDC004654]|uniref:SMI1/KNR4 family protein n=1 Tax=Nocardia sp. NPDC004654 TaxID=3154776 RepID=UPI0033A4CBB3
MAVGYYRAAGPAMRFDIERLEERIGRGLPEDYKGFLMRQDGGRVEGNDQAVNEIFCLRDDAPNWASIWWKLDVFSGRIPNWLLPVASDEYGNLFAISLRDSDFGSVWFWDHEEETDEDESAAEDNIECRSVSWSSFIDDLQPLNDSES